MRIHAHCGERENEEVEEAPWASVGRSGRRRRSHNKRIEGKKAFASLSSLDASPGPVLPPLPRGGGLQTEGKSRAPRYTVLQWTIKQRPSSFPPPLLLLLPDRAVVSGTVQYISQPFFRSGGGKRGSRARISRQSEVNAMPPAVLPRKIRGEPSSLPPDVDCPPGMKRTRSVGIHGMCMHSRSGGGL